MNGPHGVPLQRGRTRYGIVVVVLSSCASLCKYSLYLLHMRKNEVL